mmetsp:Transcript_10916/g.15300  ORF Transcript_10916/g.15300 Transcript_10916/m.15300 type:complete len:128 (+) Transcript_10916:5-388(+)
MFLLCNSKKNKISTLLGLHFFVVWQDSMGQRLSHDDNCECILCLKGPLSKTDEEWNKEYEEARKHSIVKKAKRAAKKDVKKGLIQPINSFFPPTIDGKRTAKHTHHNINKKKDYLCGMINVLSVILL